MRPISIEINNKFREDVAYYAHIVVQDSFKNKMKPRFGDGGFVKHYIGKMGEMAFFRFCMQNGIAVKHIPFRDDYSTLNDKDDFVIITHGVQRIVEVKTSVLKRKDPLDPPEDLQLFYNKKQYDEKAEYNHIVVFAATNSELTKISLLGWIPAYEIRKYPVRRDLKSPAYAIPYRDLRSMIMLTDREMMI
ncbi:hypothetical protein Asulf_01497 [Archaeoglobus sulfaticallidus PM70-1]|uniref:Uncharacterized protein n=1 Tax=Archaeoglobus sulfaticallidus PM70-1 TaxID=387631 RepID=N0BMJ7_9EURY|nr:hypothetical protein [Archaeoglobus sulfaticallidus]AGK61480.1 hypothetical protein Asulf_01497 [Archaeoglobus sulfaticallidus PM70-1]